MSTINEMVKKLENGDFLSEFSFLYNEQADLAVGRYKHLVGVFEKAFGCEREIELFSAPGRTEIIGNHTDHQHGCVIAQAVNLDIAAVVSKNDDNVIRIHSVGYPPNEVLLENLEPSDDEYETSEGLVRGVAADLKSRGYNIGGFDAVTSSDVPGGSGLSSSAAFEVLIGTVLSELYNEGNISREEIAKAGQLAENKFFGKPSGLMDQMASSVGGLNFIDFHNISDPKIVPIDFDFNNTDYALCIVKTGGSHADLTGDYAAIPAEMKEVANECGCEFMRDADIALFFEKLPELRKKAGDRAVLRALNFIDENERVGKACECLLAGDMQSFKRLILQSGRGSFMYLQNVVCASQPREQGLALALALTERLLLGRGAWRVHGGGFAGTIQAFVPKSLCDEYVDTIERVFGEGSCIKVFARPIGGYRFENSR